MSSNIPSNMPPKIPFGPPTVASNALTKNSTRSTALKTIELHENIPSLESATNMIANVAREINSLTNTEDIESLEQITRHLEQEIEQLNEFLSMEFPPQEKSHLAESFISTFIYAQNKNELVSKVARISQATGILSLPKDRLGDYKTITNYLSSASILLETLTGLSSVITKNNLLNTEKEKLKFLRETGTKLEIKRAEKIVKKLEFEISKENKKYILNVVLDSADLADAIYSAIKLVTYQADIIAVSSGLAIGSGVASIISATFKIREAGQKVVSHAKHTEDLKPFELLEKPTNLTKPERNKIGDVKNYEPLYLNQMSINLVLEERKKHFDARMKMEEPEFKKWMDQFIKEHSDDFNQLSLSAEKKGINLSEDITSVEEFKNEISKDQSVLKNEFQIKYIENQDTLTSVAKNLLKERLLAHEKINHNFFTFKHSTSKIMFGVTVITSLGAMALVIATLAGVAFPPVLAVVPAIIGLAASFGMLALGLYNLHNNKPNLTETIFHFVKASILLNKIPLLFSSWRLARAKENQSRIQEKITDISSKLLTDKLKEHQLTVKKQDADDAVLSCELTYNHYHEKIEELENKIIQARKDDFELTGFTSFKKVGHVRFIDGKAVEDNNLKDEFTVISEALIKGKFWKDPEANAFLKKYGGVKLAEEVQLGSTNFEEDSNFLSEKLRHVILRNSSELLAWLEKR